MRHLLLAFALISSSAFARTPQDAPVPVGVITSIKASIVNGGISPDYAGVKLEGTIKAGNNSCEAARFVVGIKQTIVDGSLVFIPFAQPKLSSEPSMCIALYDANFPGVAFSQTFSVPEELLSGASVKDVYQKNQDLGLSSLLPAPESVAPSEPQPNIETGDVYVPNGVITAIAIHAANGGINPDYAGITIEGTIKAGGNGCEGRNYEVGIETSYVGHTLVFQPYYRLKADAGEFMCAAIYEMNYKGVAFRQTFVLPEEQFTGAIVKDVLQKGRDVELSKLAD